MAGTTTNGFPYPLGSDRVRDGDDTIKALAEAIETKLIDASQKGVLLSKLSAAQTAIDQGKRSQAIAQLEQFISQVQANAGKKIDAALADRMIGWARDLISRI